MIPIRTIWHRPECPVPFGGHEHKPIWKRFRTHSPATGQVTCTLCSLYIGINHHALQLPTEIMHCHQKEQGFLDGANIEGMEHFADSIVEDASMIIGETEQTEDPVVENTETNLCRDRSNPRKVRISCFRFSLNLLSNSRGLQVNGHFTLNNSQAHILRSRFKKPLNPRFLAPQHKM